MGAFDDILAQVGIDEADKAVILKYPALVSRVDNIADLNEKNQAWFATKYDWEAGKTIREKELEAAVEVERERAATLAAAGNSEMNFDQIEAALKAKGYMSKTDVDAQIAQATNVVKQHMDNRDLGTMRFAAETATLAISHEKEFGTPIDVNGFTEYVAKSSLASPRDAYNQYVAGLRAEAQVKRVADMETKHAAELEQARSTAAAEARKQALIEVAQNGGGMPVDQGRGGNLGWMQQRQIERTQKVNADGSQGVPGGKLGDGSATAAIMAQLAQDRANGTTPTAVQ